MDEPQIGGRIRRLRRQRRVSQADLAEALGISASYLNLIEHNRRKLTVPLLFKFAGYFGIEPGELADSDDGRLLDILRRAWAGCIAWEEADGEPQSHKYQSVSLWDKLFMSGCASRANADAGSERMVEF